MEALAGVWQWRVVIEACCRLATNGALGRQLFTMGGHVEAWQQTSQRRVVAMGGCKEMWRNGGSQQGPEMTVTEDAVTMDDCDQKLWQRRVTKEAVLTVGRDEAWQQWLRWRITTAKAW